MAIKSQKLFHFPFANDANDIKHMFIARIDLYSNATKAVPEVHSSESALRSECRC